MVQFCCISLSPKFQNRCFQPADVKMCADTFEVDVNYFRVISEHPAELFWRLLPASLQVINRMAESKPESLCEGLRWAGWDAVLGARDEGEGLGCRRAREVSFCGCGT